MRVQPGTMGVIMAALRSGSTPTALHRMVDVASSALGLVADQLGTPILPQGSLRPGQPAAEPGTSSANGNIPAAAGPATAAVSSPAPKASDAAQHPGAHPGGPEARQSLRITLKRGSPDGGVAAAAAPELSDGGEHAAAAEASAECSAGADPELRDGGLSRPPSEEPAANGARPGGGGGLPPITLRLPRLSGVPPAAGTGGSSQQQGDTPGRSSLRIKLRRQGSAEPEGVSGQESGAATSSREPSEEGSKPIRVKFKFGGQS